MPASAVTIAANPGCELGENPLWHPERRCVYWTDIPAGKIHRFDCETKQCRTVYQGVSVGGFTLQQDDSLLLFRVDDIARLTPAGEVLSLGRHSDEGMSRFNDVIADAEGRVFAGTLGRHPQCGLYRVDVNRQITKLFDGTGCSNGMGFSPDLKIFYWTCTTTRRIYRFNYDRASGNLSGASVFYETGPKEGLPDGLAVDAEGFVWSARWGGKSVVRHRPDGSVCEVREFPVRNITSLCFGGENLNEIFVTSAREAGVEEGAAGALFRVGTDYRGRTTFRSGVLTA
jgi:D-xylonolactonase